MRLLVEALRGWWAILTELGSGPGRRPQKPITDIDDFLLIVAIGFLVGVGIALLLAAVALALLLLR